MHNLILGFLGMMAGFIPHISLAQLDLEALLVEPEAGAAETAAVAAEDTAQKETADAENTAKTSEVKDEAPEIAAEEPEVKDEAPETSEEIPDITEPTATEEATESAPETPDVTAETAAEVTEETTTEISKITNEEPEVTPTSDDSEAAAVIEEITATPSETPQSPAEKIDEDDFMAQYIDEVTERDQENSAAQQVRSDAMKLIMQKDNNTVFSDDDARELFEKSAQIREEQKKLLQESLAAEAAAKAQSAAKEDEAATEVEKAAATADNDTPDDTEVDYSAPFGLTWGMSKEEVEAAGFELQEATAEDLSNVFLIKNPQQKRATFERVIVAFGEQNHLYIILAQTPWQEDTPSAEKVLKLYHDYYAALDKKYGNAKEYYKPNQEHSKSLIKVGYDVFLQDLAENKASLFATFSNRALNIMLSVAGDAEARSHILLEYENTQIKQQEKEENLNELINDL